MTTDSIRHRQRIIAISVIILILLIDQAIKFLVKTSMPLHEQISLIGNWAQLFFTENKGMAFGLDYMGTFLLTILRLLAIVYIIYLLVKIFRDRYPTGFIVCLSMVLAGAAGNILDNIFYGLIFTESTDFEVARLVPFGEGYGSLFEGKVVDMFYFPIIQTTWPNWMPIVGGEHFVFFSPIFNFADAAITTGAFMILIGYPRTFSRLFKTDEAVSEQGEKHSDSLDQSKDADA